MLKKLCQDGKVEWTNHIHVVCGIGEGHLWIITAYRPSLEKWESDLKTRKEH